MLIIIFLESLGTNYSHEKCSQIADNLYTLYSSSQPYEVFPDALKFLQMHFVAKEKVLT